MFRKSRIALVRVFARLMLVPIEVVEFDTCLEQTGLRYGDTVTKIIDGEEVEYVCLDGPLR